MKKLKFLKWLVVLGSLGLTNAQAMCTEDDVEHARYLAKAPFEFSPILHWQTIEEYTDTCDSYYVANSFNPNEEYGEIAVFLKSSIVPEPAIYPDFVYLKKLACELNKYGCFSYQAPYPPKATLKYRYYQNDHGNYSSSNGDEHYLGNRNIFFRVEELKVCDGVKTNNYYQELLKNYFKYCFLIRTKATVVQAKDGTPLFANIKLTQKEGVLADL